MAAAVETMGYVGEVPWHGLGNAIDEADAYNPTTFIKACGLDWEAEKVPLVTQDTQTLVDHYAVRRSSDKSILGTVGSRYTIVQNEEAFKWFAPWLEAKEAALHTAGALFDGARIWVLAKLNRDPMEIAAGDIVEKYILLSHSHDGSLAVRVGYTPIRVVCNNTLTAAHSDKASKLIRLKHSKKVHENLDNLREVMNLINQEFEATAEQYRLLVSKSINQDDLRKYVRQVFKVDAENSVIWTGKERTAEEKELCSERQKNIMDEVLQLCEAGKGNNLPSVRGTYWAAYNGVTEYLNYKSGRNTENRLNSLWFGPNATMGKLALDTAVELATVA